MEREKERSVLIGQLEELCKEILADFEIDIDECKKALEEYGVSSEGEVEILNNLEYITQTVEKKFAEAIFSLSIGDAKPIVTLFRYAEKGAKYLERQGGTVVMSNAEVQYVSDGEKTEKGMEFWAIKKESVDKWRKILEGFGLIKPDLPS